MNIKLNSEQEQVVFNNTGPFLVIAGAGTGKTTAITERIKYLLKDKKLEPQQVLALTFTEKASAEMLNRLDMVMPLGYQEPWVTTFHSFCDRILRQEGLEIGLSPDYQILTQPLTWIFLKKNLFNFNLNYYRPLGNPTKFITALLRFFSRLQDEDISVKQFLNYVKQIKQKNLLEIDSNEIKRLTELSQVYWQYQQWKLKENVLDFGDLIVWTLELFRKRKNILKKYQQQFKHILVDEFQDTNFSQLQLIKLLAPSAKNPNLIVVGDDSQSIYKWRGAAVSNILDVKKDYPEIKTVILNKNYRSTQPLLDASYKMIKYNEPESLEVKLNINKSLKAWRKEKIVPKAYFFKSLESEVNFVVKKILSLVSQKPYTYKDFAILARANSHLDPFILALNRSGIPYQLVSNRGLFDKEEVQVLIHFIKAVVNPKDDQIIFQLLNSDIFFLGSEKILNLLQLARTERKSLWLKIMDIKDDQPVLQNLVDQINKARKEATQVNATEIIFNLINQTGFVKKLIEEDSLESQLKINNLDLFFNIVKSFESDNKQSGLVDLVEYLDLLLESGENPPQAEIEDVDTVSLLTVHSAKGLEFPVVFIVNAVADRFPTRKRSDPIDLPGGLVKEKIPSGDFHLQEERRLFYVAATRAKDYLIITAGKNYGGTREKRLSGFINELGLKVKEPVDNVDQISWHKDTLPKKINPKKIIDGKLNLDFVSYSQIDVFKTCPLKYKYRYVLRVPTKPHFALTFGQSVHNTLRDFHLFEKQNQKPDKKMLLHLFNKHFIPFGYLSKEHRQERFKSGKKSLKNYFDNYQANFQGKPFFLEKNFRINIDGAWLIGKIDRVDILKDGKYELIDYKTGAVKKQKEVDKDAQLTIYKLAAEKVLGIKVDSLALYFIEENKKIVTTRNNKQLKAKIDEISRTINEIKTSRFKPKPNHPFPCSYCEYNQICPFAKKS